MFVKECVSAPSVFVLHVLPLELLHGKQFSQVNARINSGDHLANVISDGMPTTAIVTVQCPGRATLFPLLQREATTTSVNVNNRSRRIREEC